MRKAIVQLGAGPVQRGLLARIEASGLATIVVDRATEPAGAHPSSVHVRAPIDDPSRIVPALERMALERPDLEIAAVLTSTDLGVASVPVVADALGLPHASPASILAMDDKERAKARLAAAGVSVPAGRAGRSHRDLPRALELARGTGEVVIKPVDSSGSRGVRRVRGPAAIREAVHHALEFGDRFLVEECVEGDHLDINGFVRDGRFELVSIGRRFFTPPPRCVPIYGGIDSEGSSGLAERVTRTMQRAISAFDYQHGPVKADAIDADRGLVVLELAARFHGDVFSVHLSEAAGQGAAALHWLAALGLLPPPRRTRARGAWFAVFAETSGTIASIEGLDRFRGDPAFRDWIPRLGPGDEVGAPEDNRSLVGFGLMRVGQDEELWSRVRTARAGIRVRLQPASRGTGVRSVRRAAPTPSSTTG